MTGLVKMNRNRSFNAAIGYRTLSLGWRCKWLTVVVTGLLMGCPDLDPPPTYYADLGEEGAALLPPARAWHDAALKEGQAEWHPFKSLQAAGKDAAKAAPSEGGSAAGNPTEAEVRKFIQEFNEVAAEKDYGSMPDYYVERQRGQVKEFFSFQKTALEKTKSLVQAIEEKAPGKGESLRKSFDRILSGQNLGELKIESLSVVSETEVTGKIAIPAVGMPIPEKATEVRFVSVKGEWQMESGALEMSAQTMPMLQAAMSQFDGMIEGIRSGAVPVDALVTQLETALNMSQQFGGQGGGDAAESSKNAGKDQGGKDKGGDADR